MSADRKKVWAIMGGVRINGQLVNRVISMKEGTRKYLGLSRASTRFLGERVEGTSYRAMVGGKNGASYTLILRRRATVSGRQVKSLGFTIPSSVPVAELVIWAERNIGGKVSAIVTPRGNRHTINTDLGDRTQDLVNDASQFLGNLIPDIGDNFSDAISDFIPDVNVNPGQFIRDAAGLLNRVRSLPGVP